MKIGQYLAKIWTNGSGLLFFGPPCRHAGVQNIIAFANVSQKNPNIVKT